MNEKDSKKIYCKHFKLIRELTKFNSDCNLLTSRLRTNTKLRIFKTMILPFVLIWSEPNLSKRNSRFSRSKR